MKIKFRIFLKIFFIILSFSIFGSCQTEDSMYSGTWTKSGVSPYEDKGPLEICVGPHRISSPGGTLGGFCQKLDAPKQKKCTVNEECNSRELCICGTCSVKYCVASDECPEGTTCDFANSRCVKTCETDCDCPGNNARCDLGICQQMCIVDGECQAGELCSVNRARCITAPCSHDADCYSDEQCILQVEPRVIREPSLATTSTGEYYMWLEMNQGAEERKVIFRATSYDMQHWYMSPPAPVLESNATEGYWIGAPSVIRIGSRFLIFYEINNGESIGRAVSSDDGRTWIKDSAPVLLPNTDEESLHSPHAVLNKFTEKIMLYYQSGAGKSIKMVVSSDFEGSDFSTSERNTVLTPEELIDPVLWRTITKVESPFVITEEKDGKTIFKMWVSAKGFESGEAESFGTVNQIKSNYSIAYLVSYDGYNFIPYPFNPVFDVIAPNSFVNHLSELSPTVIKTQNSYIMFYGKSNADNTEWKNLGWAKNPPIHEYPHSF